MIMIKIKVTKTYYDFDWLSKLKTSPKIYSYIYISLDFKILMF